MADDPSSVSQQLSEFVKRSLDVNPRPDCPAHGALVSGIKLCVDIGRDNSLKLDRVLEVVSGGSDKQTSTADINPQPTQNGMASIGGGKYNIKGPWQMIVQIALVLVGGLLGAGSFYAATKLFLDERPQHTERKSAQNTPTIPQRP